MTHTEPAAQPRAPATRRFPVHLLLLVLSAGGVAAAAILWVRGQGWLSARVLAGDALLIFALLLSL